jgi:hypothetical protein
LTLHTTLHKSRSTLHKPKIPQTHHISQRVGKEKKEEEFICIPHWQKKTATPLVMAQPMTKNATTTL